MVSRFFIPRLLRCLIIGLLTFAGAIVTLPDQASAEVVCSKAGSEFDFDNGYIGTGDPTSGMRAKLSNPDYFGPGGAIAPESLTFSTLGTVSAGTLSGCDIFIGGGFQELLSDAEGDAIAAWVAAGSNDRAVIGGCDDETNLTCLKLGRNLNPMDSDNGVALSGGLAYNPLSCGGAGGVRTFGGAATWINTFASDTVLAQHSAGTVINDDNGVPVAGKPAVIIDDTLNPTFLMTADADMFASSGNASIGNGATATSDQALFVVNAFKFVLDGLSGRLANPTCYIDYDRETDLAFAMSASTTDVTIGGLVTVTMQVSNQSTELTGDIAATIPIPSGFTFVTVIPGGDGAYDNTNGLWTIGNLLGGDSASIQVTMTANATGSRVMPGQITSANLPDVDSAPNAGFAEDDLNDGLADDDERSISFVVPEPFVCNGTLFQIAESNSTLKRLNFSANGNGYSANLTDVASAGANLNSGWGYNELDDLIYGVPGGSRNLYRIDSNGVFTQVATLDNTFERGGNAGDILPDGTMIYKRNKTTWQALGLGLPASPTAPLNLGTLTVSPAVNPVDFSLNPADNLIYGIDNDSNRLFYVDVSGTGDRTIAPQFFGPATFTGAYGAQWFDADGRLYVYDNNSNEISVINVGTNGNGTASATLLAVSANDEGGINDGAYCRGPAPVPLGAISGTVYEDANGSDARDGGEIDLGAGILVSIYYDNGTPLDTADDRFLGTTETIADGTYFIDGLVTIETYRIEVDENDADLPPGANVGTSNPIVNISVTANTTTTGQDFGFDPGIADLSITKTAEDAGGNTITTAAAGSTVVWVISVTNSSTGSPSGVRVSDLIPDGFTYVSDDAPATGDIYDVGLGIWFVDEILGGVTETLRITTTANGSGSDTNFAEIISSSLPDPDSDPDVGRLNDDLGDGIADDDETSYTVSLGLGGSTLSGRIFNDNGATGGTAHDALITGAEVGIDAATLSLFDGTATLIAAVPVNADGTWTYTLPPTYSGSVTVTATPITEWLTISEQTTGLPALAAGDAHDGTFTFTPVSGTSYPSLDIGLIQEPTLTQSQTASISGGQVIALPHLYTATTTASVTFSYADVIITPAGAFSVALFEDTNCDGTPDTVIGAPRAVDAGDSVCLVSRISASAGIGPGAQITYGLTALSAFTATTKSATARNDDVITAGGGDQLVLQKTVRNVTKVTPEGTANVGDLGDVLEYRLTLTNPSGAPAINVTVNDQTPAYTTLTGPIPSPVTVAAGVTCSVTVPAVNTAGYAGPLEWDCPGNFPPGELGSLTFQVTISP